MFTDLHIHSTESDGTDSPEKIVEKILQRGIKIFALTDHDTISGIEKIKKVLPREIFFINGVEFSCKIADDKKCHILAYFYDSANENFQKILRAGYALRKNQFDIRLNYLSQKYNIIFTEADVKAMCTSKVVGKPHIVNFVSKKYGLDKDKLYKNLRECYVGSARQDAATVIQAVKDAGGVAVWAHPLGGEGEPPLSQAEFKTRLQELINFGIGGLECFYSRYTNAQEKFLAATARENNLYISGGSDYHGANKTIALGELGADSPAIKIHQLTILQKIFECNENLRVRKAFEIAKAAHSGQFDKAGENYIYHPLTVALNFGGDISAMVVSLLHDVAEDTSLTLENLHEEINLTAAEFSALELLTHDKNISYFDYIQKIKSNELATKVKIADLKNNSDLSRIPAAAQSQKDFSRVEKYKQALHILRGG